MTNILHAKSHCGIERSTFRTFNDAMQSAFLESNIKKYQQTKHEDPHKDVVQSPLFQKFEKDLSRSC